MPRRTASPSVPLPRGWTKIVRSATLHAISVAMTALTTAWGRAATGRSSRLPRLPRDVKGKPPRPWSVSARGSLPNPLPIGTIPLGGHGGVTGANLRIHNRPLVSVTSASLTQPYRRSHGRSSRPHRLASLLVRTSIKLLALLPMGRTQRLGRTAGRLAGWLPTTTRRRILSNLALCYPHLSVAERRRFMRRSLMQTGCTVLEWAPLLRWGRAATETLITEVTDEHLLSEPISRGRGVVLAPIHLGAWELLGLYLSPRYTMTTLYRPLRLRALEDFCRAGRERFGATLVPTGYAGLRRLHTALKRGELVAVMPDQDPGRGQGVFAPLFGQPANTGTLVSKLARRARVDVIFACVERLGPGRGFRLHFHKGSPEVLSEDEHTAARSLNEHIERLIREAPDQYMWRYRRFRKSPPGMESASRPAQARSTTARR